MFAHGVSASIAPVTGSMRVLWSEVPTFTFLNWRKLLNARQVPDVSRRRVRLVIWCVRIELLLLRIMPLLAVFCD
jgi:putative membrane protein